MQQLFRLLIFLIQSYMFRATNSPILRNTSWLCIQLLVQCTDRQQCRCIVPKAVCTVKKCSWGWANLSPETCRTELKRLIKEKLLHLVGYLHRCTKMMHGHTNTKFCYILFVLLYDTLMIVAKATETCRWIVIRDKASFIGVNMLVCHIRTKYSATHGCGIHKVRLLYLHFVICILHLMTNQTK